MAPYFDAWVVKLGSLSHRSSGWAPKKNKQPSGAKGQLLLGHGRGEILEAHDLGRNFPRGKARGALVVTQARANSFDGWAFKPPLGPPLERLE